jgi:hypothetical protein
VPCSLSSVDFSENFAGCTDVGLSVLIDLGLATPGMARRFRLIVLCIARALQTGGRRTSPLSSGECGFLHFA